MAGYSLDTAGYSRIWPDMADIGSDMADIGSDMVNMALYMVNMALYCPIWTLYTLYGPYIWTLVGDPPGTALLPCHRTAWHEHPLHVSGAVYMSGTHGVPTSRVPCIQ